MSGLIPDDTPQDAQLAQYMNLLGGLPPDSNQGLAPPSPSVSMSSFAPQGGQLMPTPPPGLASAPPPPRPAPPPSPAAGALSGSGPVIAQQREQGLYAQLDANDNALHQQLADRFGSYQQGASNYKDLLNSTIQSIQGLNMQPTDKERLGRMAQAIGAPTRTGSFGERMANLGGANADLAAQDRNAQLQKAMLIAKYTTDEGQLGMQIPMAGIQQLSSQLTSNDARRTSLALGQGRQNSASAPIIIQNGQPVVNPLAAQADAAKAQAQQKGRQDAMAGQYTPEAMDLLSDQYRLTGKLNLPYGATRANPGIAAQIIDMAAQKESLAGNQPAATLANQASYHAASLSMNDMTKLQSRVASYEQTAEKNMDLAIQLGQNVDRTGSPLVNKGLIAWRQGVTGDADTAGFVTAIRAAQTEYAKVLSGATGAAGITNAADTESKELFSKITNQQTLEYVLGQVAKQEMHNRTSSIQDNLGHLQDIMTRGSGAPARPATPGTLPGTGAAQAAAPAVTATGAHGEKYHLVNGQWVQQ